MEKWNLIYKQIESHPDNLDLWQDLVECIESGDVNTAGTSKNKKNVGLCKASSQYTLQLFRFTYDNILLQFPLLENYWIRYARWEFKLGETEKAQAIYVKAIGSVPYSIQIWAAYAEFTVKTSVSDDEAARTILEQGAQYVGNHFLAHMFWDHFIEFEKRNGSSESLAALLLRIIQIPLHQYAKYFEMFFRMIEQNSIPLEYQAPAHTIQQFRAEYELELENERETINDSHVRTNDDDLKDRIVNYHYNLYVETQTAVAKRFPFESAIRRHYFDVVYNSESDRVAWRRYLDFSEIEGNPSYVSLLYERAILATALDQEFWLRYVRWLMASNMIIEAENVLRRACLVLPVGRPNARLYYARLKVYLGQVPAALQICENVLVDLPGCLECIIYLAHLKNRVESMSGAKYLRSLLEVKTEVGSMDVDNVRSYAFNADERSQLVIELATMHLGQRDGLNIAQQLYSKEAASLCAESPRFWRHFLQFVIDHRMDPENIREVFDSMRTSGIQSQDVKSLSHIYLAYLASQDSGALADYIKLDRLVHAQ